MNMITNIDSNIEKLFFNFTLSKPMYLRHVHGYFFKNEHIAFIYNVIRNDFMSSDASVEFNLTTKEVIAMVRMFDDKDFIDNNFIKALLKIDLSEYKEDFIMKRYEPWVKSNLVLNGLMNSYESIRNINVTDIDDVEKSLNKIKRNINDALDVKLKKGDIGLDFDNLDDHDQRLEHNKISSGYDTFDTITDGGFDRKTFTVFMGSPGSGKSLTMQNLAVNMANNGYNVAYISLELSDRKCMKRIGSMRLEIPIKDYNELSKDKEYMKSMINKMNHKLDGGLGMYKPGKLFIKEFPSGSATVSDIDAYCQQVFEETGINVDALIIDYLQIMNTENGVDRNMLYLKGEHLSVGVRGIAQKRDLVAISATQTDKNKYGTNSYSLADIPESKSIADTADMVWGIILTPIMKVNKVYQWQWLKLRDASTDIERIEFDFNGDYLKLTNDRPIIL